MWGGVRVFRQDRAEVKRTGCLLIHLSINIYNFALAVESFVLSHSEAGEVLFHVSSIQRVKECFGFSFLFYFFYSSHGEFCSWREFGRQLIITLRIISVILIFFSVFFLICFSHSAKLQSLPMYNINICLLRLWKGINLKGFYKLKKEPFNFKLYVFR